jgi:hypothetical protein
LTCRLREAIKNTTPKTVFDELARTKNFGAALARDMFVQVLLAVDPALSTQDLERCWQLVDKNADGGVTYESFAAIFDGPRTRSVKHALEEDAEERAEQRADRKRAKMANLSYGNEQRSEKSASEQGRLKEAGFPKISCKKGHDIFYDPRILSAKKEPRIYCGQCQKMLYVTSTSKYTTKKSITKKSTTKARTKKKKK